MSWHSALLEVHVGSGIAAILAGFAALAVRKGGPLHARAGTFFLTAMLVLGVSASILEPFRRPVPGSPAAGVFVCYFVLTSWVTARRRDGRTGWFEAAAGAVALALAGAMFLGGLGGATPAGRNPGLIMGCLCLLAGGLDLSAALRRKLTAVQRVSRHLWRMCFAFFIATGSFFLGQQKVMPAAVRGSPILLVLAFAPFAFMAFWLVKVRLGSWLRRAGALSPPSPACRP